MKRREVIVVFLGVILFGAGLLIQIGGERMRWQGEARFVLRPISDDWYTRDPHLMEREMAAISNTLVNPVFLKALASTSKVEQSEFELIDVVPIRGTHIVLVRFAGADRDVERVASNTFGVLEQFCFTNRSEINTENIEATLSRRRVLWERLWHQWEYRRP